ncbi:claudin-11 isoform X2 [Caretta caretta]|uniref:claudin-11 isoform X2 n=1 Tax=Caretta caretta TaxID=8467 RepID=UPI002095BC23|nr:claudin-11 isoform X2 [Caretta caretta]
MVATCLHLVGFVSSFVGWIGVIVATATNEWVVTCGYTITTCRKMDELGSKGLWADCVMATGLYHCKPLVDILILPGYVQACRALMIAATVLGLPAVFLLLTVLPCIRMGHEPGAAKYRRSQLGGVLLILLELSWNSHPEAESAGQCSIGSAGPEEDDTSSSDARENQLHPVKVNKVSHCN